MLVGVTDKVNINIINCTRELVSYRDANFFWETKRRIELAVEGRINPIAIN